MAIGGIIAAMSAGDACGVFEAERKARLTIGTIRKKRAESNVIAQGDAERRTWTARGPLAAKLRGSASRKSGDGAFGKRWNWGSSWIWGSIRDQMKMDTKLTIWDEGKTAALKANLDRLSDEEIYAALSETAAGDVDRVRRSALLRVRAFERGIKHPRLALRPPLWAFLIAQELLLPELVVKCDGNEIAIRVLRLMDEATQRGIASGEIELRLAVEENGQLTHRLLSLPDATRDELQAVYDDEARRMRPLEEQLTFALEKAAKEARRRRRIPDGLDDVDGEELSERKTVGMTEAEVRAAVLLHHEQGLPLWLANRRVINRV